MGLTRPDQNLIRNRFDGLKKLSVVVDLAQQEHRVSTQGRVYCFYSFFERFKTAKNKELSNNLKNNFGGLKKFDAEGGLTSR